jgi:hypothetical protein
MNKMKVSMVLMVVAIIAGVVTSISKQNWDTLIWQVICLSWVGNTWMANSRVTELEGDISSLIKKINNSIKR